MAKRTRVTCGYCKSFLHTTKDHIAKKHMKKMGERRKPALDKVGCYFTTGEPKSGFEFFTDLPIANGDVFVFKDGILWKLR